MRMIQNDVMMKSKRGHALNLGPKNTAQKWNIIEQNQKKRQKL